MGKKSIDRKAVNQFIIDSRKQGKSDQDIYNELTQQYYDKKTIALLITSTVTPENKEKYKGYNNLLLALIGVTILFKILFVLELSFAGQQIWGLFFVFLVPLWNIYFFYEIGRYNGPIYRLLAILTIAGFLQGISKEESWDLLINLVVGVAIVWLAFYLDMNMFPSYSPKNLKKDSNGEYILDHQAK